MCRLWYLERKYAELQIMAFRCHHCHLTLRFSCSRLHYCAVASCLGRCRVRQICGTWVTVHPEQQCSPSAVGLIAKTLPRSPASIGRFVGACVCVRVCARVCTQPSSRPHLVTAERNQAPATGTCSLCGFLISLCFRQASLLAHPPDPSSLPLSRSSLWW